MQSEQEKIDIVLGAIKAKKSISFRICNHNDIIIFTPCDICFDNRISIYDWYINDVKDRRYNLGTLCDIKPQDVLKIKHGDRLKNKINGEEYIITRAAHSLWYMISLNNGNIIYQTPGFGDGEIEITLSDVEIIKKVRWWRTHPDWHALKLENNIFSWINKFGYGLDCGQQSIFSIIEHIHSNPRYKDVKLEEVNSLEECFSF